MLGRLPEFTLPQLPEPLKPSRSQRSSTFEVGAQSQFFAQRPSYLHASVRNRAESRVDHWHVDWTCWV